MRVPGKGQRKIQSDQKSRRLENNPPTDYWYVPFIFDHASGFTFVGMLVAVSILSIVASSVYTLVLSLQKGYNDQVAIANMQQEARVALSVFSTEVQQAGLDPSGQAFSLPAKNTEERYAPLYEGKDCSKKNKKAREARPIMEASDTVFHFMKDENPNGKFTTRKDTNEDIRYEWVGGGEHTVCTADKTTPYTLYRDTGGGAQEVALGIREFKLTYFDENGAELINVPLNFTDRDKIRSVRVTLKAHTEDESKKQSWTSNIVLKNRE